MCVRKAESGKGHRTAPTTKKTARAAGFPTPWAVSDPNGKGFAGHELGYRPVWINDANGNHVMHVGEGTVYVKLAEELVALKNGNAPKPPKVKRVPIPHGVNPRLEDGRKLANAIQTLESEAHSVGYTITGHGLNHAKNACGWEAAGDFVKAGKATRGER